MTKIIGLTGAARSGKDTTAGLIKAKLPEAKTFSFAEPIYDLVSTLINTPICYMQEDPVKKDFNWYFITQESLENAYVVWSFWGLDKYADFPDSWQEFFNEYLVEFAASEEVSFAPESTVYALYISPRKLLQLIGTEWGRNKLADSVWVDNLFSRIEASYSKYAIVTDVRFDNEAAELVSHEGYLIQVVADNKGVTDLHESEKGVSSFFIDYKLYNKKDGLDNLEALVNSEVIHKII